MNHNQQLRDQNLQEEKDLALRAGTQISEKNMQLQTSLETIREEKKALESEHDAVIAANAVLKKKLRKKKKKLEKIQYLEGENQQMKEELEASKEEAKERTETYERTMSEYEKETKEHKHTSKKRVSWVSRIRKLF